MQERSWEDGNGSLFVNCQSPFFLSCPSPTPCMSTSIWLLVDVAFCCQDGEKQRIFLCFCVFLTRGNECPPRANPVCNYTLVQKQRVFAHGFKAELTWESDSVHTINSSIISSIRTYTAFLITSSVQTRRFTRRIARLLLIMKEISMNDAFVHRRSPFQNS